jgi:uncharacterized protein YndB with AHSA1/START domain
MPASPEQVWMMIATGNGLTLWLTRMSVEERAGGKITMPMDGQDQQVAEITAWEPPHRLAYVETEGRKLAHEFTVEARDGGTSHVRMVYSGFDSRESWEQELEAAGGGWKSCFDMMEMCLRYFPAQVGTSVQAMASLPGTREEAWTAYTSALGIQPLGEGARVASATADGAPELAGEVVHLSEFLTIIRLDAPAPGLAWIGAGFHGGAAMALAHVNFFGEDRDAVEAREQPIWESWLQRTFPAPAAAVPATEAAVS